MTEPIKDKEIVKDIMIALKNESPRNAIMFGLGIYEGLRISDILRLRVEDVRHKWNIQITEKKTGRKTKLTLNRELKKLIDKYTEDMNDRDYLIKSRKGYNRPISETQAYRIIQEIANEFNLKNLGCHSLRKTFAYHMYIDNKKNIGLVQKALGHESSATTMTYIGVDQELVDKAIMKIKY